MDTKPTASLMLVWFDDFGQEIAQGLATFEKWLGLATSVGEPIDPCDKNI